MATHSRIRRLILITGTTLSLLIAVAFVVSAWWSVDWCRYPGLWICVNSGHLDLVTDAELLRRMVEWGPFREGWSAHGHGFQLDVPFVSLSSFVVVPLWVPFVAVGLATLLVWRLWPKPVKPGHCACGYDLTGNVSGTCPECGREAATATGE